MTSISSPFGSSESLALVSRVQRERRFQNLLNAWIILIINNESCSVRQLSIERSRDTQIHAARFPQVVNFWRQCQPEKLFVFVHLEFLQNASKNQTVATQRVIFVVTLTRRLSNKTDWCIGFWKVIDASTCRLHSVRRPVIQHSALSCISFSAASEVPYV
jgi:hypothetical protein